MSLHRLRIHPHRIGLLAIACILQACSSSSNDSGNTNPPPTLPSVSVANAAITEGDSGAVDLSFNVSLSSSSSATATVDYATSDGTGTAGSDYQMTSGTATFNTGVTTQTVTVTVLGDMVTEPDENFILTLSNPSNATLGTATALGTIFDDDGSSQSGLPARPSNTTCLAPDRPTADSTITTADAFPNLPGFSQPVVLLQAPGDNSRWFIVEQSGVVRVFDNNPAVANSSVFVDITARVDDGPNEAGLLGMTFHPDFQNNDQVFLSYTRSGPVSYISRFTSPDNGQTLDPNSEAIILTLNQPFGNHNGGNIAFGPDGFLYIGFGDGGSGGDPLDSGQDTNTLLGAMLRIDVDNPANGLPYGIPADNPFASSMNCSGAGCPEIYAWGFRNPWRWSFDRGTGDLWLGDVGQNAREEVDRVELGGNYGWRCYEGNAVFNTAGCGPASEYIFPVTDYTHSVGNSITGGYVYRGTAIPNLVGTYLFADFVSGRIWGLSYDAQGDPITEELLDTPLNISSFGEGNDGELYILNYGAGRILQIVENTSSGNNTIPTQLSATGCVMAADPTQPETGLIPYTVNAPFWADGATRDRWIALPDGTNIDPGTGDWDFPVGSVIMKNFIVGTQLIETRLLMRHPDGEWGGYSYEWNGADATLVVGGKTKDIGGQTWIFPSSADCLRCHTTAAGRTLGLETAQLNRDFTYPSTGITANQLTTFQSIALFSLPLPDTPNNLPAYPNPEDQAADLELRARAYLHTNCSQCHRPNGPTGINMDLRFDTALANADVCDVSPLGVDLGIANARILAPGDPARSLLSQRMQRRDAYGMPPLASHLVDTAGAALLDTWIAGLASCP